MRQQFYFSPSIFVAKQWIICSVLILLGSQSLNAQYFGVHAGYLSAQTSLDATPDALEELIDHPGGILLGFHTELPISKGALSFRPELNYSERNYRIASTGTFATRQDYRFSYLDMGGLLQLNLWGKQSLGAYVGVGAYYSFAISGNIDDGQSSQLQEIDFVEAQLRRAEVVGCGLIGISMGNKNRFFIEGRYFRSFHNQRLSDSGKLLQQAIGILVGIKVPIVTN